MEQNQLDLAAYMSGSIRRIMAKAYKNVLANPREAKFAYRMQRLFEKSEKRRRLVKEQEGLDVPPFLISSISTTCNLACKGCYARTRPQPLSKGGEDGSMLQGQKVAIQTPLPLEGVGGGLSPFQWRTIFEEAVGLGINFSLLAGGEPLMRKDLLEEIAEVKDMIFPVFTNGTLIGLAYLKFFDEHLNLVPIISLEGLEQETDQRRGRGVYRRAKESMAMLAGRKLFFGASITVTTENFEFVTSRAFLDQLQQFGCKIVFYIEYVPIEEGTEHLAFTEADTLRMEQTLEQRRTDYEDIIFLSFPGDEKALGGCLASGRGFFHIGPDGRAEPCPFSPFSDSNVAEMGLRQALQSPLFRKIRAAKALGWEHTGGCTLYEHREEIERMRDY